MVRGTTTRLRTGETVSNPSTAERTEMAGVITPIAVKECCAEHPEGGHHRGGIDAGFAALLRKGQRQKGQNTAFPVVIRTEHDPDVLQRNQEDQAPENQRDKAINIRGSRAVPQTFFKCVEWAGSNVAKHDPQRNDRQWK
jgi:hypothetical protein